MGPKRAQEQRIKTEQIRDVTLVVTHFPHTQSPVFDFPTWSKPGMGATVQFQFSRGEDRGVILSYTMSSRPAKDTPGPVSNELINLNWVQWCTPFIPELVGQRQLSSRPAWSAS